MKVGKDFLETVYVSSKRNYFEGRAQEFQNHSEKEKFNQTLS